MAIALELGADIEWARYEATPKGLIDAGSPAHRLLDCRPQGRRVAASEAADDGEASERRAERREARVGSKGGESRGCRHL